MKYSLGLADIGYVLLLHEWTADFGRVSTCLKIRLLMADFENTQEYLMGIFNFPKSSNELCFLKER